MRAQPWAELEDVESAGPEARCAELELRRAVFEVVRSLPPRYGLAIHLHFGIGCQPCGTMEELGALLGGVTGSRAQQVLARALRMLRHPSRSLRLREHVSDETREEWEGARREWVRRASEYQAKRLELEQAHSAWTCPACGKWHASKPDECECGRARERRATHADRVRALTQLMTLSRLQLTPTAEGLVIESTPRPDNVPPLGRAFTVYTPQGLLAELEARERAATRAADIRIGAHVKLTNGNTHRVLEAPRSYGGELLVKLAPSSSSSAPFLLAPIRLIADVHAAPRLVQSQSGAG